jgi:hypothetical protein
MGVDKNIAVAINGALSTTVGDLKGILGGIRHLTKMSCDESNRDVANISLLTRMP